MMVMNRLAHPKYVTVRMPYVHLANAPAFVLLRRTEDLQVLAPATLIHGVYVMGPDRGPEAAVVAIALAAAAQIIVEGVAADRAKCRFAAI